MAGYEMSGRKTWSRLFDQGDDVETGHMEMSVVARHGFIKKVFGILCAQIFLTAMIGTIFVASDNVKSYVNANPWTLWLSIIMSFGLLIGLICFPSVQQTYPTNYILLGLFTLAEGFLIGAVVATYDVVPVLIAFFLTAGVTLGLTIFAMQTKIDFTVLSGVLFSALIVLILMGFLSIFLKTQFLNLLYAGGGTLLFSAYLVYDVQLIAGGRKYEFSVDDYVPAALAVYLDVINLFLFILRLIGDRN